MSRYRKTIVAAAVTLASVVAAALTDDHITSEEAALIALEVLAALGVYVVPNDPA